MKNEPAYLYPISESDRTVAYGMTIIDVVAKELFVKYLTMQGRDDVSIEDEAESAYLRAEIFYEEKLRREKENETVD